MTSTVPQLFQALVALHITFGSIGLLSFWVPVIGRKGGERHQFYGRIFTIAMLATGAAALGISVCTLIDPVNTHPHLAEHEWVRGIFGWMMQGLALLTINLAWYGWLCIRHRNDHAGNLEWRNLALQVLLTLASINCAWQSFRLDIPLMLGMPAIGIATVATNLWFLFKPARGRLDWLKEHIKALVGAGISVYTAFFAFGAVRTVPTLALHPGLWSIPLIVGLTLIVFHQRTVARHA